jgi:hypothetical protein
VWAPAAPTAPRQPTAFEAKLREYFDPSRFSAVWAFPSLVAGLTIVGVYLIATGLALIDGFDGSTLQSLSLWVAGLLGGGFASEGQTVRFGSPLLWLITILMITLSTTIARSMLRRQPAHLGLTGLPLALIAVILTLVKLDGAHVSASTILGAFLIGSVGGWLAGELVRVGRGWWRVALGRLDSTRLRLGLPVFIAVRALAVGLAVCFVVLAVSTVIHWEAVSSDILSLLLIQIPMTLVMMLALATGASLSFGAPFFFGEGTADGQRFWLIGGEPAVDAWMLILFAVPIAAGVYMGRAASKHGGGRQGLTVAMKSAAVYTAIVFAFAATARLGLKGFGGSSTHGVGALGILLVPFFAFVSTWVGFAIAIGGSHPSMSVPAAAAPTTSAPSPALPSTTTSPACASCGAALSPGVRFCERCGSAV